MVKLFIFFKYQLLKLKHFMYINYKYKLNTLNKMINRILKNPFDYQKQVHRIIYMHLDN